MAYNTLEFSDEMLRIAANLEQRYDAWLAAVRESNALPSSMFWSKKSSGTYLAMKKNPGDNGTTKGVRNNETEAVYQDFLTKRSAADEAVSDTGAALAGLISTYKKYHLPIALQQPARILRQLDIDRHLGYDLLVVGTCAFSAYEIEAGCRFTAGINEATDDFDLSWCRGSQISLSQMTERPVGSILLHTLKAVDQTYRVNKNKPYQAINSAGYEVELLAAPSMFKTLSENEVFSPMPIFVEQEWLLRGTPVRHVIATRDSKACPIFAPDPRWMAVHKLWLAEKPERNPLKKPKDRKQGDALLDMVRDRMQGGYPLDTNFVIDLPEELLPYFNRWAADRHFVPGKPRGFDLR